MKATIQTVNETGLAEIRAILSKHHKLGGDHFTKAMIDAWAAEVEFQLAEGNSPSFEIRSWDNVSGYTQVFTLSDESIEQ
jgi:predicted NUDIX family NTP pyrophosphohydrolase